MINIELTENMLRIAQGDADAINSTDTVRNTINYTGVMVQDRYFVGNLGELAFEKALNPYRHDINHRVDGKSDGGIDFVVYYQGKPLKLDVKTAGLSFHKCLMQPELQFQKYHGQQDYYVGLRLNRGKPKDTPTGVDVIGYVKAIDVDSVSTVENIKSYTNVITKTRKIENSKLTDIETMFNYLDKV